LLGRNSKEKIHSRCCAQPHVALALSLLKAEMLIHLLKVTIQDAVPQS